MAKLKGKAKAAFLARMKRGRAAKARRSSGGGKRRARKRSFGAGRVGPPRYGSSEAAVGRRTGKKRRKGKKMGKLRGKAKKAFLARMARGRRKKGHHGSAGGRGRSVFRAKRPRSVVIVNPSGGSRRRRHRNPGFSLSEGFRDMMRALIPAAGAGAAMGFIDAKFLGDKSMLIQVGAKVVLAVGAGIGLRRKPQAAAAAMGAILGAASYSIGLKAGGGVVAGSKIQGMKELAQLAAEDQQAMGMLAHHLNGMGLLQADASAGDPDLGGGVERMPDLGGDEDQDGMEMGELIEEDQAA